MDTVNDVLSSKWRVTRWPDSGWVVETVDQLYSIKKDGTPKKGVKPKTVTVALVFSKAMGQHISDVHNLCVAQDKVAFLKDELREAIQQVLQRHGINSHQP